MQAICSFMLKEEVRSRWTAARCQRPDTVMHVIAKPQKRTLDEMPNAAARCRSSFSTPAKHQYRFGTSFFCERCASNRKICPWPAPAGLQYRRPGPTICIRIPAWLGTYLLVPMVEVRIHARMEHNRLPESGMLRKTLPDRVAQRFGNPLV